MLNKLDMQGVMKIKLDGEMFENVIKQLEKHNNDEHRKIIFHPSIITYDNSIAKTREHYRWRNRKNRTVYKARKILGYE